MRGSRTLAALLALALVVAAAAVYLPVLDYPFVAYDDDRMLLANPAIRGGLSPASVSLAFTSVWEANWAPLTWISHMLDFSLHADDAGAHHRTNLVLHLLNVLLLFAVLREATGATLRSAFVAGLLALHPIHVESVAWISERKGLLSSTFGLASLWCYVRSSRGGLPGARHAALLLLALGLLAKAMLVTLPLLLLLLDDWPLRRLRRGADLASTLRAQLREKWPFFAVVALSVVATLAAQSAGGAVRTFDALPLGPRLANALLSTVGYLGHLLWPADLAIFYPHRSLPGGPGHAPLAVAGAAALLLAISVAAWRAGPSAFRTGWLWYLVALLPVCGILQVGNAAMADRYAYLPAIGVYVAITWTLADLAARLGRAARLAAGATAVVALLIACVAARGQLTSWRSSEALFRHALAHTSANYTMHFNLANVLKRRGQIEPAIAEYLRAVEIFPRMGRAHYNLANTLLREGRTEEAVRHYRAAADAMPTDPVPWTALGRALIRQGDLPAAVAHYERDVERRPDAVESHGMLAHLLRMSGRLEDALREYEAAARLAPQDAAWRRNADEVRDLLGGEHAAGSPSSQGPPP